MSDASNPQFWQAPPNTVLAGPASGSDNGDSGMRALVAADLPAGTGSAEVSENTSSALSSAVSAGLATSIAKSEAVSAGLAASVASSEAVSAGLAASVALSTAAS